MKPATCHPDRNHEAHGLCPTCYRRSRYIPRVRTQFGPTPQKPTCHPNEIHVGNGKCRKCYNREYMRSYGETPKAQNTKLLRLYGITYHDWWHLYNIQDGKCAICMKESTKERLSVDHCHTTGKVRGLLCRACNRALGIIGDANIANAAAYLGRAA